MRAVVVAGPGGPEVLTVGDLPAPEPGDGQLLVEVAAAGVNYIDVYQRTGRYPVPTPFTLGLEGSGRVGALGPGVSGFAVGDRVAWADQLGSYAEQVLVAADRAVPVPDAVDDERAAAALLQGMTAQYLVSSTYPVQAGDTVLVHAAAGGVGLLLVQMARLRGAVVLGTASTREKADLAIAAGADAVIDYTTEDVAARARELTGGVGVAAVYDGVGASTFDASLAALRPRGTLALFGGASGPVPAFDPMRLSAGGSLFLTRPTLFHYVTERAELLERAGEVLSLAASGDLDLRIGGRYALADAGRAHEDLEARRTTGKVLLLPE